MKNNSYDKKILRLMFILNRLSSKETVTTPTLAQEFNVTTRTVQRDLELLSQTGFPTFFDNGTYKFTDGFSLRKINITKEEKFLLMLFYKLFSKIGQPFNVTAKNLLDKILSSSNSNEDTFDKRSVGIINEEFGEFSNKLAVRLENSEYPKAFIKKIDEYLLEVRQKLDVIRSTDKVNMQLKVMKKHENGKPAAVVIVPKAYFKDKINKLDPFPTVKERNLLIKTYLPNKLFRTFRIELYMDLYFKFWGTHFKSRQITCFDKFAGDLGFSKNLKLFNYEYSYGGGREGVLITRASLSWMKEIPMPLEEIKPFLNKSGGIWKVIDYSNKKRKK